MTKIRNKVENVGNTRELEENIKILKLFVNSGKYTEMETFESSGWIKSSVLTDLSSVLSGLIVVKSVILSRRKKLV